MHTNPSLLWTLEEISQLVSGSGNPAETLTNIVNLIQQRFETDVCSVYLLEPDRSTLVLAATIGLRPESVGRVKMRINEGLAGLVAEQLRPIIVEDATQHPRFKYFREAGEDAYRSFLGVPLVDRGVLQGVLVVQTAEPRAFARRRCAHAGHGRRSSSRRSSARRARSTIRRPGASAALAASRGTSGGAWDPEALEPVPRARPGPLAGAGPQPDRPAPQMPITPAGSAGRRAGPAQPDQLRLPPAAGVPARRSTPGGDARRRARRRPVAYFSAEFGLHESLPIYSGGLGVLAGDHLKSASDLGMPLVGVGLFYGQGYFRQRLDVDGWQQEDYLDVDVWQLPLEPADRPRRRAGPRRRSRRRAGTHRAARLAGRGRPQPLLLLDSRHRGQQPRGPRAHRPPLRRRQPVRIRQELLLGVGGVRALRALGIRPGVLHLNEGHCAFAGWS